MIQPVVQPVW